MVARVPSQPLIGWASSGEVLSRRVCVTTKIVPEPAFMFYGAVALQPSIIVSIYCSEHVAVVIGKTVIAVPREARDSETVVCAGVTDGKHVIDGVGGRWEHVSKHLGVDPQRAGGGGQ